MSNIVLRTNKLTKRYKKNTALHAADMTIYEGDIYGIIGRNGAGKTTLMKIITGLTNATDGEFELFSKTGFAAEKERKRIGCLIENPAFFGNMTAYENLKYYAIQKGITNAGKIDEVLELVQLKDARDKKFKSFSLGMKQRLGIALALLDNPDLVILDEPINGLDPIGISQLRDTFHMLNKEQGLTLMISSHILSELYAVANRFVFVDKGHVIKELTKEELDLECQRCIVIRTEDVQKAVVILENQLDLTDFKVVNEKEIRIYADTIPSAGINKCMVDAGVSVSEIFESGITLEDYFKSLVEEA